MGTMPLMDQAGAQWRYNTSSQVLRRARRPAAGQPAQRSTTEPHLGPGGMKDTGFGFRRASELGPARAVATRREVGGVLEPFDDDGQWSPPASVRDGGAGLCLTVGDTALRADAAGRLGARGHESWRPS